MEPRASTASVRRSASRSMPPRRTGNCPIQRMIQPSGPTNSSALAMNATGRRNAEASSTGSMLLRWFEARMTGPAGTWSPPSTRIRNQTRISGLTTAPAIRNPRSGFLPFRCPPRVRGPAARPGPAAGAAGASPAGARGASRWGPPVISGGWLWPLR